MEEKEKVIIKEKNNTMFVPKLLGIYVILIGVGLPLAIRNMYFDILSFKYYYYCFFTITTSFVLMIYYLVINWKKRKTIKNVRWKDILKQITLTDYFALIWLLIAAVSTITSDYLYEAFWGNEGRLTGLFLMTWYVVSYFCVSRLLKFKTWYIDAILASGVIVAVFGITDYFGLDIFGFKEPMVEMQRNIFTSTIGNINTYTAYMGMIVAVATILFSKEKNIKKAVFYYVAMVISFYAIIMGNSDNAYLSLGALFAFSPLYLFENNEGIKRYIVICATFLSVIRCIGGINTLFYDRVLGIDSFFNMIIGFRWIELVIIGLWLIVGLWNFVEFRRGVGEVSYGTLPRWIWSILLVLFSLSVLYILYDCNVAGNVEKYEKLSSFVLFNDDWGTHRGYIWRNAMEEFVEFPLWKKIFGFGPETFRILLMQKTWGNPYNQNFDNAHNEYLQLLLTVGIAGLCSYLVFIFSAIKRCFNNKTKNYTIIAIGFGLLCYSLQAFVNLNVPAVTPIFWLLLSMGVSGSLENDG